MAFLMRNLVTRNEAEAEFNLAYSSFKAIQPALADTLTKLFPPSQHEKKVHPHSPEEALKLEEQLIENEIKTIPALQKLIEEAKTSVNQAALESQQAAEQIVDNRILSSLNRAVKQAISEYKNPSEMIDSLLEEEKNPQEICKKINNIFETLYQKIGTHPLVELLDQQLTEKLNEITSKDQPKIFNIKRMGKRQLTFNDEVKKQLVQRHPDTTFESEKNKKTLILNQLENHFISLLVRCEERMRAFIKNSSIFIDKNDKESREKEKKLAAIAAQKSLQIANKIKDQMVVIARESIEFNKFFTDLKDEGITHPTLKLYLQNEIKNYIQGDDEKKSTQYLQSYVRHAEGLIRTIQVEYKNIEKTNIDSAELKTETPSHQSQIEICLASLLEVQFKSISEQTRLVDSLKTKFIPLIQSLIAINKAIDIMLAERTHLLSKTGCWSGVNILDKADQIEEAIQRALLIINSLIQDPSKNDKQRVHALMHFKLGDALSIAEAFEIKRRPKATPHMFARVVAKIDLGSSSESSLTSERKPLPGRW